METDVDRITQTKADQLPKVQHNLSLQFCEAMASWLLVDKHIKAATEMPLKPTVEGRLFWPLFLGCDETTPTKDFMSPRRVFVS
jgi:hypothetical protein